MVCKFFSLPPHLHEDKYPADVFRDAPFNYLRRTLPLHSSRIGKDRQSLLPILEALYKIIFP